MSKWGNFLKALQIAKVAAKIAGAHGVKIKDVPLDKIATKIEQAVKDAKLKTVAERRVSPDRRVPNSPGD